MYRCNVNFYLTGCSKTGLSFEEIKAVKPFENFTHTFFESDLPDDSLTAKAGIIFAYIGNGNQSHLDKIVNKKSEEAELIVIAEKTDINIFDKHLEKIDDIWFLPMSTHELKSRFIMLQRHYKAKMDSWETANFLNAAMNNSPNLVWFKNKNGIHEKVNDSFCKTVNKPRSEVEGHTHAHVWDVESDSPACIKSETEVMMTGNTYISEETVNAGKDEKLLTTYKSPLYDTDGSIMGTVGIALDITKERAFERDILEKSRILETLFMSLNCGIMCHSVDGTQILNVNAAALKILGYTSKEEMLKDGFQTIAASVVEEDKKKLKESIENLNNKGDNVSIEYSVRHKDGKIIHILGNIKLIEENGELYYQRFMLDITENKMREDKMRREQEKRHNALVQALAADFNLVCFFDIKKDRGTLLRYAENNDIKLDPTLSNPLHMSESLKSFIEKHAHPDDKEMLKNALSAEKMNDELVSKKMFNVNFRLCDNEKTLYYQAKIVRIGDWETSEERGIVIGLRSIDDEIRSEMEQKTLLETALNQANKANKAKSVFLSNMSHDIRTPMNAIVGFTSLAMTHIDSKDQVAEYLKKIMTSGNHLLSLINDVLDMSRIESGKMHLDEKLYGMPDILHGLRNILQADAAAKEQVLSIGAVDIVNENIYCDKLRLNQVLLNLLSNAVKYTPSGGTVSMTVTERHSVSAEYAQYEFKIKDTGIGMSKEFTERIFEPFERERNTTISGIQGTGLGMAITKNIVEMMNGTISVQSEKDVGTEVTVCFTFRIDTKNVSPVIEEFSNRRALVVNGDFNTCDNISAMLQRIGMRTDWTLSGKEAMLRIKQAVKRNDPYCVYVIDRTLPDKEGIALTKEIKALHGVPSAIILTDDDWTDIEDEAKAAGVSAFWEKPLFISELSDRLRAFVSSENEDSKASGEKNFIRSGRILLAEDNPLNQEIAQAILTEAGFTVDVAENGQIALDMLKKAPKKYYRLILMDIQMPVMNGYESAKAIRSIGTKEMRTIPIIAMTANAFEEDKQEALKNGMNGHVAKPIDIDNLFSILDEALN